jgi:hypothetical protein
MTLMSARPWKHPRTGVYWYRRRIPADLIDIVGRAEEKFSLRTKDPAEAKRLHAEALAASERRWQGLRLNERPLEQEEVIELARSVHDQCGNRIVQSSPVRVRMITAPFASIQTWPRKPSNLCSNDQSGPLGTVAAGARRAGDTNSLNISGSVRAVGSIVFGRYCLVRCTAVAADEGGASPSLTSASSRWGVAHPPIVKEAAPCDAA